LDLLALSRIKRHLATGLFPEPCPLGSLSHSRQDFQDHKYTGKRKTQNSNSNRVINIAPHWETEGVSQNNHQSVFPVDGRNKVLLPTRHKIGHFGNALPNQSLGSVLKKTNPAKLTKQNQSDCN